MSIELGNQCCAETSRKTQDLHGFSVYHECAGVVWFVVVLISTLGWVSSGRCFGFGGSIRSSPTSVGSRWVGASVSVKVFVQPQPPYLVRFVVGRGAFACCASTFF